MAFSGLSFDLWAIITLVILNQPIGISAPATTRAAKKATRSEKILITFFPFLHLLLFFILAASPANNSVTSTFFMDYFLLIGLITGTATYLPPFLVLHRKFRNI